MIRFLRNASRQSLEGTALVRLDFNTEDTWRLVSAIPTLKFLFWKADRIIIISHKGRPNGFEKRFSLSSNASVLSRYLRRKVIFTPHFRFSEIRKKIAASPHGSVFLLENLRFIKGEETNDKKLARQLASLGDYYVNDAFAVSHRANASVAAITRFLPSFAGLGLEAEIKNLGVVMKKPKKPLVVIVGGAKAGDKLGVLRYFKNKATAMLLGGAAANTLLEMQGINVGRSVVERERTKELRPLLKSKNVFVPIDYVVSSNKILDVGPKTARHYGFHIKRARTIIWNGPLGVIEKKRFAEGTLSLVRAIGKNKRAFSITGGGETVMFLKKHKLERAFDFISTGGGAMLDFLAGKKLPGIQALEK